MIAVVRIRGRVGLNENMKKTLELLRLKRKHSCVVLPKSESYLGMVKKVSDFVAWGELDFQVFLEMLKKRGRIGRKRLTQESLKQLGFASFEELAKQIWEGRVKIKDTNLKPFFGLTPPRKGFKSTRKRYPEGALGYWGEEINSLLRRMI
jgi:large subunit ribosomal protein L30